MQLDGGHYVCKYELEAPSNKMLGGQEICTSHEQNHSEIHVTWNILRVFYNISWSNLWSKSEGEIIVHVRVPLALIICDNKSFK